MPKQRTFLGRVVIFAFLVSFFLLVGAYFLPLERVNWGKIEFLPASTITVTGQAKREEASQIASFSVSVTASNDNKQTAIDEVNTKMADIIQKVKDFGIDEKDLKTQNVSVYESPEVEILIYPPQKRGLRWTASNSLEIKLKDASQASQLADLLNATGATSVSGPNFTLDNTQEAEVALLEKAIANARQKAEKVAQASGRRLGKIITVSEGGSPMGIYPMLERAVDTTTPIEPGTETVYKSVTVIFELK
jgi:uncharacterized protein YggE